jgi:hypothetical protein
MHGRKPAPTALEFPNAGPAGPPESSGEPPSDLKGREERKRYRRLHGMLSQSAQILAVDEPALVTLVRLLVALDGIDPKSMPREFVAVSREARMILENFGCSPSARAKLFPRAAENPKGESILDLINEKQ